MTKKLTAWEFNLHTVPAIWDARRPGGRSAKVVRGLVLSPSKTAAAKLFGVSLGQFNNYALDTHSADALIALADHPPMTLLIRGLDSGDTIRGLTVWQLADQPDALTDVFVAEMNRRSQQAWNSPSPGLPRMKVNQRELELLRIHAKPWKEDGPEGKPWWAGVVIDVVD